MDSNLNIEAILPGFEPIDVLWDGESAIYKSQHAARWALRELQQQLIQQQAMARLHGRLYIRRDLFVEAMRARALAFNATAAS